MKFFLVMCAFLIGGTSSLMADVKSVTLTPFVGVTANDAGDYMHTGIRVGVNIGDDWAYELSGALRQNKNYGQNEQDYEYSIIAKKENIASVGDFKLFAGAGLGKVFNSGGVTALAGVIYPLPNGDAIRVDVLTQFTHGTIDNTANIGYVITF